MNAGAFAASMPASLARQYHTVTQGSKQRQHRAGDVNGQVMLRADYTFAILG